jgi:hypothetical protein
VASNVSPVILYVPAFCPSEKFLPTNQTNTYITQLTTNKARRECLFHRYNALVSFSLSIFSDNLWNNSVERGRTIMRMTIFK